MKVNIQRLLQCLLLFVLIAGSAIPSYAAEKVERVAKVTAITGDVKVKKAGGAKPFKAFNNMAVTKGDQIITGKDSSVQLLLDDGSKLVVGSNTQSIIGDLIKNAKGGNQTSVKVVSGQVWSKLESLSNANDSFQFETPTAVMGIRGTMLLIKDGTLYVTEGAVNMRGTGPSPEQSLVLSNEWGEASRQGNLQGGKININALVDAMDLFVLREAVKDIVNAVYEARNNPELLKIGKGVFNDFLQQAAEFVAAAQAKDPTIQVPQDFPQVAEEVKQLIEQNQDNPNNPNPGQTISNGNHSPVDNHPIPILTGPKQSQQPGGGSGTTSGNNGSGSGGGSGGGGGGGSSQPKLASAAAVPVGDGQTSRVTITTENTNFLSSPPSISFQESDWGNVPFYINNVRYESDQHMSFEVTTPDDGKYAFVLNYKGKALAGTINFFGAPSSVQSITVSTTEGSADRVAILKGRNLGLENGTISLTMTGGPDPKFIPLNTDLGPIGIPNYRMSGKSELTFIIPDSARKGTYTLTLKVNDKTYMFPAFEVPSKEMGAKAAIEGSDVDGSVVKVSGIETNFKQNETVVIVSDSRGKEVYRASGSSLSVDSETELHFSLPESIKGQVTLRIITGSIETSCTLEIPRLDELQIEAGTEPILIGKPVQLHAMAKMSNGAAIDITDKAKWKVSPAELAAISPSGKLTGMRAGKAVVSAAYQGKTTSATITIQATGMTLAIKPSLVSVEVGKTVAFTAEATMPDGKVENVTDQVQWTVADTSIATMSGNTLSGREAGKTSVKASFENMTAAAQVEVIRAIKQLTLTPEAATVLVGEKTQFSVTARYEDDTTEDVTAKAQWTISDSAIASVEAGLVTATQSGNALIRAQVGEQHAEGSITVIQHTPPVDKIPPTVDPELERDGDFAVLLTFSEPVDRASAEDVQNYTLDGYWYDNPEDVELLRDQRTVRITNWFIGDMFPGESIYVTVRNVKDKAGNPVDIEKNRAKYVFGGAEFNELYIPNSVVPGVGTSIADGIFSLADLGANNELFEVNLPRSSEMFPDASYQSEYKIYVEADPQRAIPPYILDGNDHSKLYMGTHTVSVPAASFFDQFTNEETELTIKAWGQKTNGDLSPVLTSSETIRVDLKVPSNTGMGISFTDTDPFANQLAGTITVNKATDESDIVVYRLLMTNTAGEQIVTRDIDASGTDLSFEVGAGTSISSAEGLKIIVTPIDAAGNLGASVEQAITDDSSAGALPFKASRELVRSGSEPMNVTLTFNQPVDSVTAADQSKYVIYTAADTSNAESVAISLDKRQVTLQFSILSGVPLDEFVRVSINGVKDATGTQEINGFEAFSPFVPPYAMLEPGSSPGTTKIANIDDEMEWRKATAPNYTAVPAGATSVDNISASVNEMILVRYRPTSMNQASADKKLMVSSELNMGGSSQSAPLNEQNLRVFQDAGLYLDVNGVESGDSIGVYLPSGLKIKTLIASGSSMQNIPLLPPSLNDSVDTVYLSLTKSTMTESDKVRKIEDSVKQTRSAALFADDITVNDEAGTGSDSITVSRVPTGARIRAYASPSTSDLLAEQNSSGGDVTVAIPGGFQPEQEFIYITIKEQGKDESSVTQVALSAGFSGEALESIVADPYRAAGKVYPFAKVTVSNGVSQAVGISDEQGIFIVPLMDALQVGDSLTVTYEVANWVPSTPSMFTVMDDIGPQLISSSSVHLSADKKLVQLFFNMPIRFAPGVTTPYTNYVELATDGISFQPLSALDSVTISGNMLEISLDQPLAGSDNVFRIAADVLEGVWTEETNVMVETPAIDASITVPPPVNGPGIVSFTDTDYDLGTIGGILTWTAASSEDDIDEYEAYYLNNDLGKVQLIGTVAKGSLYKIVIAPGTTVPNDHNGQPVEKIGVISKNAGGYGAGEVEFIRDDDSNNRTPASASLSVNNTAVSAIDGGIIEIRLDVLDAGYTLINAPDKKAGTFTVTSAPNLATEGTDYTIDAQTGMLTVLPGSKPGYYTVQYTNDGDNSIKATETIVAYTPPTGGLTADPATIVEDSTNNGGLESVDVTLPGYFNPDSFESVQIMGLPEGISENITINGSIISIQFSGNALQHSSSNNTSVTIKVPQDKVLGATDDLTLVIPLEFND